MRKTVTVKDKMSIAAHAMYDSTTYVKKHLEIFIYISCSFNTFQTTSLQITIVSDQLPTLLCVLHREIISVAGCVH